MTAMNRFLAQAGIPVYDAARKAITHDDLERNRKTHGIDIRDNPHYDMEEDKVYTTARAPDWQTAHELIHWTGHGKRLNRDWDQYKRAGVCCPKHAYALEELTAERGSPKLCRHLGVPHGDRTEELAYWRGKFSECCDHEPHRNNPANWRYRCNVPLVEAERIAEANSDRAVNFLLHQAQNQKQAA